MASSRGKRLLIGCGLGCGTLILLVIILVVTFSIWINQPGELLEPRQLLGRNTTGYLEWTLRLEDAGTEGFAQALIESISEIPLETQERLPAWLQRFVKKQQRRKAEGDIRKLFPMVLAWTYQPGATPDSDLHVVTASIERIGRQLVFADWILGFVLGRIPETNVLTHERETIYQLPLDDEGRRLTFFMRDGHFFLTSDAAAARIAIERLGAAEPGARPTELEQLFDTTTAGTLRGALINTEGRLPHLISQLPFIDTLTLAETDPWTQVHSVHLTGGLNTDGSLTGTLDLRGPDPDWAATHSPTVDRTLRSSFKSLDLPLDLTVAAAANHIRVDFRIDDVPGWLAHLRNQGGQIYFPEGK